MVLQLRNGKGLIPCLFPRFSQGWSNVYFRDAVNSLIDMLIDWYWYAFYGYRFTLPKPGAMAFHVSPVFR